MLDLNDTLAGFVHTIVHGDKPAEHLEPSYQNYLLTTAIEVYRNNYRGNLHDALAGAYPVIKQLVGDDFFRMMALNYVGQHPSHSPNLHHYGTGLSEFIAHFEPARELAYLPDVAALEWACHTAYFAPDEDLLDLGRLAQFPPEQHPYLIFRVHPSVNIVRSPYPVNAIWQAHQSGSDDDFHIDLDSGPCVALVSRSADTVQVDEMTAAEAVWLEQIQAGISLGNATDTTLEHYPNFDLPTTLLKLVTKSILIDVR